MSKFCFQVATGDRVKYVCIEAPNQESADVNSGVFSGEGQIERIDNKNIPSDIKWNVLTKLTSAWESQYFYTNG
jgi:hypothetical protein